mmetsp:Transcript_29517/g.90478  ORF Transcript_29517/g.90478 Transcript_29517/m.90478 type:complete len:127 (+) Transcript_29517:182-562(+)
MPAMAAKGGRHRAIFARHPPFRCAHLSSNSNGHYRRCWRANFTSAAARLATSRLKAQPKGSCVRSRVVMVEMRTAAARKEQLSSRRSTYDLVYCTKTQKAMGNGQEEAAETRWRLAWMQEAPTAAS